MSSLIIIARMLLPKNVGYGPSTYCVAAILLPDDVVEVRDSVISWVYGVYVYMGILVFSYRPTETLVWPAVCMHGLAMYPE